MFQCCRLSRITPGTEWLHVLCLLGPGMDVESFSEFCNMNVWERDRAVLPVEEEKVKVLGAQSCLTLCSPMDCSPLGSFVHGVFQARVLEWVAISFSRKPA